MKTPRGKKPFFPAVRDHGNHQFGLRRLRPWRNFQWWTLAEAGEIFFGWTVKHLDRAEAGILREQDQVIL